MNTELLFTSSSSVETELLAVFAADTASGKDAKPEIRLLTGDVAISAAAQSVLAGGEFRAEANETLLLHAPAGLKAKRLLLVGLGKVAKLSPQEARKGAGTAVRFVKPRGIRELAIAAPESDKLPSQWTLRALTEGITLADVDTDTYRSDRKDRGVQTVKVIAPEGFDRAASESGFSEGLILGGAQNFTRSLVNEPGNRLTPTILGRRAAAMCGEQGLKCEVYSTEKLIELKMGAFQAVAQGSDEPPALIVMTWEPAGGAAKDGPVLGLVGKGITFDTGGISIKPADSMEKMKYDMAGAAAMIGAMQAIAQLRPAVKVIGVVCSAENMPSGKAYKPGDVEIAMSGKSIEVINTDAEGRMVLADGLAYAKQLGATHLIDAATLTGACVVALGMINAGVFSNDDATYEKFAEGLKVSGERFWRLPVEDEYRELIRSQIADIKNTGGRWGGAITAAMFLKEFAEDTPWIHLDIAGVAWQDEAKPWLASGPTGIAVRSIVEWVRQYSH
ncbi:leucyl aminopeptidase [Paracidobacterium acidisoli]|uniref:Probable cytosol aminopeptidase n=1 Tax=Paracidobacterium acidisoli TaxID=2303751 RepID=A0A372ISX6_9BACT|nr:leucyl aminopeptidase [Paracidobacterium acidisoli]MBT9329440.1 leucyl aminopeptidase [Paracidobacterium acidisoli]